MLRRTKVIILIGSVVVMASGLVLGTELHQLSTNYNSAIFELQGVKEEVEQLKQGEIILREKGENLEKENKSLKDSNKKLENEIKSTKKKYDEVNRLYQKEIQPVAFNPNNLTQSSNVTTSKINKALAKTGLSGLGEAYYKAEKEFGVNAIFLIALTAQESGWGNSNRARTQNNLSGFAVYSDGAKGASFPSKEASIRATAKLLKNDYLNQNGVYHNGYSAYAVNKYYCPNDGGEWSNNITKIGKDLVSKINSSI